MNAKHRAALRVERIHLYRGAGSLLLVSASFALIVLSSTCAGPWRVLGIILGFAMVFIGFPIGELLGMVVAQRGLTQADVDVLHALRFSGHGDTGFLRQLAETDSARVNSWLAALVDDRPDDDIVRRARLAASVLSTRG